MSDEPKRLRRWGLYSDTEYIQTFDDDPADWDALLDAIDELDESTPDCPKAEAALIWNILKAREPRSEK